MGFAKREKTAPLFSVSPFADVEKIIDSRALVCDCGGMLGRWGHGRSRKVRGITRVVTPRRTRCRDCGVTHILLPSDCFLRRADSAAVIGKALVAGAGGKGFGKVAQLLDLPRETVRDWYQAARRNAGVMVAWFTVMGLRADPAFLSRHLLGGQLAAAVDVVLRAAAAITLHISSASMVAPWLVISQVSNGLLLHPNYGLRLPTRARPYARK